MINKEELRKKNKITRQRLYQTGKNEIISSKIVEKILNSDFYFNAKNIMIFYPLKDEVNLLPLIQDKNKNFYLPRCKGLSLEIASFNQNDKLQNNKFKIPEPISENINPEILDIIFIPALGADLFGNRIGYGKGYYDRFLNENKIKAKKVLVIQSALISDVEIKADKFDVKYDILIHD